MSLAARQVSRSAGIPVAVVVPARNAARTLDRTLCSVRGQTYSNLEIIVVDDASTDSTPRVALAHAEQDPRVRLVRNEACRGVGAARNRGVAETTAPFVAFLDADDLMTEDSIAARLAAIGEADAGMAYGWSAVIDAHDRVLGVRSRATFAGSILRDLAGGNFIGNGSAVLCTRRALEATGGYSEALFEAGAQGCEDYKFYLDVARRFPVACVPRVLIGYRETADNMSNDGPQMVQSMQIMRAGLVTADPELARLLIATENDLRLYFAARAIRAGRVAAGVRLAAPLGSAFPRRLWIYLRRTIETARSEAPLPVGSKFPCAPLSAPPTGAAA